MKTSKNQANIQSNIAFLLVDILETAFMEANNLLKADNCEFKHEAKREFNLLLAHCRKLKQLCPGQWCTRSHCQYYSSKKAYNCVLIRPKICKEYTKYMERKKERNEKLKDNKVQ